MTFSRKRLDPPRTWNGRCRDASEIPLVIFFGRRPRVHATVCGGHTISAYFGLRQRSLRLDAA